MVIKYFQYQTQKNRLGAAGSPPSFLGIELNAARDKEFRLGGHASCASFVQVFIILAGFHIDFSRAAINNPIGVEPDGFYSWLRMRGSRLLRARARSCEGGWLT